MKIHRTLTPTNNSANYPKTIYVLYNAENTNSEGGTHFNALVSATPNKLGNVESNIKYVPRKINKSNVRLVKTKIYELKNENMNKSLADIIADFGPAPVPILNEPVNVELPPIPKKDVTSPREYQKIVSETLLDDSRKGLIAVHHSYISSKRSDCS